MLASRPGVGVVCSVQLQASVRKPDMVRYPAMSKVCLISAHIHVYIYIYIYIYIYVCRYVCM